VSGREEALRLPGTDEAPEELAVRLRRPAGEPRGWILYLHGFRSSQSGEKATFFRERAVEDGFAFCSYDSRGHGESDGEISDVTPSRNFEDLSRVRGWYREQGAAEVVLLGSSMGGATALWYAARQPEEVLAVLAIAPALNLGPRLEAWAGEDGLAEWERTGSRRWADDMGEADLGWGLVEDLRRFPLDRLVDSLTVPALLLQGRQDQSVGWRGAVELATRARPGLVDLVLFGDGDHRLIDRRERLWELMRGFLAGRRLG
jgi:pimeloyl-ACP methyl ester carboxylesterase